MSIEGIKSIFYIKYLGQWFPISCETSSPISENTDMVNTTTRDNAGWKTEKPTLQSYSIQIEAVLVDDRDYPNLLSHYKLREMKRNREKIEWMRKLMNGIYIDKGEAYISNISDANGVGEEVTFTMTLNGFGKPLIDTDVVYVLGGSENKVYTDNENNLIKVK